MIKDGSAALLAAANPRYSTGHTIAKNTYDHLAANLKPALLDMASAPMLSKRHLRTGQWDTPAISSRIIRRLLHPIAVMIPTALALCELSGGSGDDFITAIVLGCEVEYRAFRWPSGRQNNTLSAFTLPPSAALSARRRLRLPSPQSRSRDDGKSARSRGCEASGLMKAESDPTEGRPSISDGTCGTEWGDRGSARARRIRRTSRDIRSRAFAIECIFAQSNR